MKKIVMKLLTKFLNLSKNHSCSFIYPEDVMIGKDFNGKSKIKN